MRASLPGLEFFKGSQLPKCTNSLEWLGHLHVSLFFQTPNLNFTHTEQSAIFWIYTVLSNIPMPLSILPIFLNVLYPSHIYLAHWETLDVSQKASLSLQSVLNTPLLGYHRSLKEHLLHFLITDHFHLEVSLDNKVPEIGTVLNL